ncbi:MAG: phosphorylcholine transferase LicD [Ruminococcus sp.]
MEHNYLSLAEIQKIELEMLKAFADFCESNNLRYYITGGSMLGAVRHKGFIPWDDDVDINMPRPDYDRMIELTRDKGFGKYKVGLPEGSFACFLKVLDPDTALQFEFEGLDKNSDKSYIGNIFMDICPLEGLPDSKIRFFLHVLKVHILVGMRGAIHFGAVGKSWKKRCERLILIPFAKLLGDERIKRMIDKTVHKYDFNKSKFIGATLTHNRFKDRLPRKNYEPHCMIEFENLEVRTTAMYKEHLEMLYGPNYMTPPPDGKKNSGHIIKAWIVKAEDVNNKAGN